MSVGNAPGDVGKDFFGRESFGFSARESYLSAGEPMGKGENRHFQTGGSREGGCVSAGLSF